MNIFHFLTPAFVGRHTSLFICVLHARVNCSIVLIGTGTRVLHVLFVLSMKSISSLMSVASRRRNSTRESLCTIKFLPCPGIVVWLGHLMWRQFHSLFPIFFVCAVMRRYGLTRFKDCELLCSSRASRNQSLKLVRAKSVCSFW